MAGYNSSAFNSILGSPSYLDQITGFGSPAALSSLMGPAELAPMTINSLTGRGVPDNITDLTKMQTKDWIGAGLGGLQTIGGLIGAFGSLNLANKQYGLQKRMMETNLTNSVQAYNTALEDKARSRAVVEGQSDAERDEYIRRNSATTGR